ncbi:hypothetical protein SPAN111604_05035 [Sphingomonas antarctica]|uniref:hypothetical protein n=1 Tax=Sphingomonas antarctica TaxID=2040274 RepID=UPI0039EAD0E4
MNEDFTSREWAESHQRFSDDFARGMKALWRGFELLTAAQFDAPWSRMRRTPSA